MCSLHIVSATYNSETQTVPTAPSIIRRTDRGRVLKPAARQRCSCFCQQTSGSICVPSCTHSRWKVEGTDCTQNWKSLLLRMTPVQISAMPLAMVETTTARIKDVDIWPWGSRPWGSAGRAAPINTLQTRSLHDINSRYQVFQLPTPWSARDVVAGEDLVLVAEAEDDVSLFVSFAALRLTVAAVQLHLDLTLAVTLHRWREQRETFLWLLHDLMALCMKYRNKTTVDK